MWLMRSLRKITLLSCGVALVLSSGCKKPEPPPPAQPVVQVITVESKSIPISETFMGQAASSKIVEIRPRVSGLIQKRYFIEGTDVNEGELLYQIDPENYQANVRDATAKVAQAASRYDLAQKNLARVEPLAASKAIAAKDLDDAVSQVATTKADLQAAQAVLDNAQIDLGYTRVVAPLVGRIGKTLVNEGSNVSAQQTKLTEIQVIDPIYVDFTVPESALLNYRKLVSAGKITDIPFDQFVVTVKFSNGSDYPEKGKLNFQGTSLDTQTDSYPLRAEFSNNNDLLTPGQYLEVTITGATRNDAILAPQRAVQQGPEGAYCYVIDKDSKVAIASVTLLRYIGNDWLIGDGLKSGDILVVEGIQRLRPGMIVKTKPYIAQALPPSADALKEAQEEKQSGEQ